VSISAAMGVVSIFGMAVQDAIIVVTYARRMWLEGHPLEEGARLAAERGLHPALMTASVALIGLLPAARSREMGSETQKPLAIVDYEKYPEFLLEVKKVKVEGGQGSIKEVTYMVDITAKVITYTLKHTAERPTKLSWTMVKGEMMKGNDGAWTLKPGAQSGTT